MECLHLAGTGTHEDMRLFEQDEKLDQLKLGTSKHWYQLALWA
jgi:hypothetical protein